MRARHIVDPNIIVGMALFYGGLAQLIAGLFEFVGGNVSTEFFLLASLSTDFSPDFRLYLLPLPFDLLRLDCIRLHS